MITVSGSVVPPFPAAWTTAWLRNPGNAVAVVARMSHAWALAGHYAGECRSSMVSHQTTRNDYCPPAGQRPRPSSGYSALKVASELLALASQTDSQSMQLPVIIWVHPRTSRTPTSALPRVPEITDTEGVLGS